MNNIVLESVGSVVDDKGIDYPLNNDGTTNTSVGSLVHIMDCDDEWFENMTCQDCVTLFSFLANTEIYMTEGYFDWALPKGDFVAKANGYNTLAVAAITEGWSIDDFLWSSSEMAVA